MQSKIDAIAREMYRVWGSSQPNAMDVDESDILFNNIDEISRGRWLHIAAWVVSKVEQAKKETRSETRNDICENGF